MKDGIIKNEGTSRFLAGDFPATYEEFRQLANQKKLPVDILFNALGWDVLPDFLNKANLWKDQTAALFGLGPDSVPDDGFALLSKAALYKTITPTAQLGTLPEGSIIYLNENGSPVPFYVAKQGYEPGYNTDRVLVVRKDAVRMGQGNSSGANTYGGSTIDKWFNQTYMQTLDSAIQNEIQTTNIPYTPMSGSTTVQRISKAVFALSGTEYGFSKANLNVEGEQLPIFSNIRIANIDGNPKIHWTRSPYTQNAYNFFSIDDKGNISDNSSVAEYGYRPAFTLSTTFIASLAPTTGLYDVSDNLLLKLPGVQIATGSYVGTGTYGRSNPNSLTFGFVPEFLMILGYKISSETYNGSQPPPICTVKGTPASFTSGYGIWPQNSNYQPGDSFGKLYGNTFSWYNTNDQYAQLNGAGYIYTYLILG